MKEALTDVGMKTRNVVIHMEYDGEVCWVKFLGEVWTTQNFNQWVYCLTNPSSGEEVPNINWLVSVVPGPKKSYGVTEPGVNSWA